MSHLQISRARAALIAERDQLRNQLSNRDGIVIEQQADIVDDVVAQQMREHAVADIDRVMVRLRAAEDALARIALGSYGDCEGCGQEISARRIELMPAASMCIRCASAAEEQLTRAGRGASRLRAPDRDDSYPYMVSGQ